MPLKLKGEREWAKDYPEAVQKTREQEGLREGVRAPVIYCTCQKGATDPVEMAAGLD